MRKTVTSHRKLPAKDHPRMRKDLNRRIACARVDHPRVCEKDCITSLFCGSRRITPAYAGKTLMFFSAKSRIQDHPRVCGKDIVCTPTILFLVGSPPRMRERRWELQAVQRF